MGDELDYGDADQGDATNSEGLTGTPLGQQVQGTLARNAVALGLGPSGDPAGGGDWPGLSLDDHVALAKAPKLGGWRDIAGKIWNAPNTAIGLAYGGLGDVVGEMHHLIDPTTPRPRVFWKGNAVQFTNNPFGGVGAITLGNTTTWKGDPYDPTDLTWHDADGAPILENGHTYPEHETPHTYQGQQLGPLYLPSNLLGLAAGSLLDRKAPIPSHGPHNWNEVGPQMNPPRPWP